MARLGFEIDRPWRWQADNRSPRRCLGGLANGTGDGGRADRVVEDIGCLWEPRAASQSGLWQRLQSRRVPELSSLPKVNNYVNER